MRWQTHRYCCYSTSDQNNFFGLLLTDLRKARLAALDFAYMRSRHGHQLLFPPVVAISVTCNQYLLSAFPESDISITKLLSLAEAGCFGFGQSRTADV